MIRIRQMLERGRAHPILGPILLIALVLVLAMLFFHAMHDGPGAATEVGSICLGIVTVLGLILLERLRRLAPQPLIRARGDRGPPPLVRTHTPRPTTHAASPLTLPLRR